MKKSYYCEQLENTLHFLPDRVKFCCSCTEGIGLEIDDFSKFSQKEVIKKREEYTEQLNKGEIPSGCKGCFELKEKKEEKNSLQDKIKSLFVKNKTQGKISHIIIDHFKQCDCKCIYCAQMQIYEKETQKYEVLPIIRQLYKTGLLDTKDMFVEFQGGNISLLKEFDELLKEFQNHGCKKYLVLSNAIKYMPALESLDKNATMTVSLDSGTKETYKQIKNVDAFDSVINNLTELKKKTDLKIKLKYIVIKGINDNKDEIKKFLDTALIIGKDVSTCFDIDYRDTFMSPGVHFEVPKHYYELFDFAEQYSKEHGIVYSVNTEISKTVLEKGYSD